MNKQLQKIAKKAGGHNNITKFRGHCLPPPPDYIDPATVDLEKFAQLVATECARIAATVASSYLAQRQQVADFAEKNILSEGQTAAEEVQTRILSEFGIAESTHPEA